MKILAAECSATAASCAISENGKIIASAYTNTKTTHSQTLMPMIKSVLEISGNSTSDIDAFSITAGPGSFTGIRIGISAVKGMALPLNKPCVPVSTLEAMARALINTDCIACCVMDARCNQVYNALFKIEQGKITRLCEDRALFCEELATELNAYSDKKVIIIGDGSELFSRFAKGENISVADEHIKYQNAECVALLAEEKLLCGYSVAADGLLPVYLRLPQAERELKQKQNK